MRKVKALHLTLFLLATGEGYVYVALSQAFPALQAALSLSNAMLGFMQSIMAFGAIAAFILSVLTGHFDKRKLLLTAAASYPLLFSLIFFVRLVFIINILLFFSSLFSTYYFLNLTSYVATEVCADDRAPAAALLGIGNSVGGIVCVILAPFFERSTLGWPMIFLFSFIFSAFLPIIYYLPFHNVHIKSTLSSTIKKISRCYRQICIVGLIWFLLYLSTQSGIVFFKEYAIKSLSLSSEKVAFIISFSSFFSMIIGFFLTKSKALNAINIRASLSISSILSMLSLWGLYTVKSAVLLTIFISLSFTSVFYTITTLVVFCSQVFPSGIFISCLGISRLFLGGLGRLISPSLAGFMAISLGWPWSIKLLLLTALLLPFIIYLARSDD